MAQKIQTLLIDDLDGGEAEATVRFGLDGAEYEIDLNAEHTEALRKAWRRTSAPPAGRQVVPSGGQVVAVAGRVPMASIRPRFGSGRSPRALTSRTAGGCRPSWSSSSRRRRGSNERLRSSRA